MPSSKLSNAAVEEGVDIDKGGGGGGGGSFQEVGKKVLIGLKIVLRKFEVDDPVSPI